MSKNAYLVALCAALAVVVGCDTAPPNSNHQSERDSVEESPAEAPVEGPAEAPGESVTSAALERSSEPTAAERAPASEAAAETKSVEDGKKESGAVPLKDAFKNSDGFDAKMKAATSADSGELELGRGAGGIGSRSEESKETGDLQASAGTKGGAGVALGATGRGGGGVGVGRIQGMGKVESGSGYGKGSASLRGTVETGVPAVRTGKVTVNGRTASGYAARGHRGSPTPADPRATSEQYTDHGVNKFVDASEDAHSTFSIDVDTGSYTIARRKLQNGSLPPKAAVRVEEFVNYFDYSYRPPTNGDPFAVYLEAAPSPLAGTSERYLFRVGVQGKEIRDSERKPVHLTFLVDVSGSMGSADKIGLVKRSLKFLTNNLQPTDSVAIATYAGATQTILGRTDVTQKAKILKAIDKLSAGGSTAMNDGLKLAYQLAMNDFDAAHENRVIVLSDGDANVGPRRHSEILDEVATYVEKGVTLSTVGFGMGNYRDTLMEQLANRGNGNYSYIDSISEAEKVFGEQLDGTLQVIAKDVKIQVEFNPKAVARYRLVGYENRDIADKDFRNDAVDAGEIGAGHTVTAIYELDLAVPADELPEEIATVRVRNKTPRGSKAIERAFPLTKSSVQKTLRNASKDYQFAAAVVAFAEKLRESPYATGISYGLIEEIAAASTRNDADRKELVALVQRAARL